MTRTACQRGRQGFDPLVRGRPPQATEQCSLSAITEPSCYSLEPCSATRNASSEKPAHHKEEQPLLSTVRESSAQPRRPSTTTKINYFLKEKPRSISALYLRLAMDLKYCVETQAGLLGAYVIFFVYYGMASVLLKMSVSIPQFQWEEGRVNPLHFLKNGMDIN